VPLERPRAFLGAGALAALGSESTPVRWGAGGRFGWLFDSGIELSLRVDYSRVTVDAALELDWLRFAPGVGYRYFASDRWSFGLALRAGVRGLGVRARDDAQQRRVFDVFAEPDTVSNQCSRDDVEGTVATRQRMERVRQELSQLAPAKAEAVLLHDVLGHGLLEIAAMTGTSVTAAQTRLSRGRRELAARLGLEVEDERQGP
jgi:hypothetical protein